MNDTSTTNLKEDMFAIHISDNMEIRNALRSGLVQAQGRDTDKIPLFVSWPEWLEDGILCMYASDFQQIMLAEVQETAQSISNIIETSENDSKPGNALSPQNAEYVQDPVKPVKTPDSEEGKTENTG